VCGFGSALRSEQALTVLRVRYVGGAVRGQMSVQHPQRRGDLGQASPDIGRRAAGLAASFGVPGVGTGHGVAIVRGY
jgi:hypothetical protein